MAKTYNLNYPKHTFISNAEGLTKTDLMFLETLETILDLKDPSTKLTRRIIGGWEVLKNIDVNITIIE